MKVLKVYKIIKENNIKIIDIATLLNISTEFFINKVFLRRGDFTCNDLLNIKNYLVDKGIIGDDYDYCDLLDLVDYEKPVKNKK